jgi:cytohesin
MGRRSLRFSLAVVVAAGLGCHGSRSAGPASTLDLAASRNDVATIKAELAAGVPVDRVSRVGYTALHYAVADRNYDAVIALLDAGADPNHADDHGDTPLMKAASRGLVPIAKALLARHADARLANTHGLTALHYAAQERNPELVRLLLEAGADPKAADRQGRIPADLCKGDAAIMAALRGEH